MKWASLLTGLLTIASAVIAKPVDNKQNTLVIVDNGLDNSNYQSIIDDLEKRDHKVEIKNPKDEFELMKYEQLKYDNLLVLPTLKTRSLGNKLSSKNLMEFFNAGGNVITITGSSSVPESIREFASELDIFVSPKGYKVVDHFEKDIKGRNVGPESIYNGELPEKLKESSSAAYLGNNEFVIPLIHAGPYSYVYDSRDEDEVAKQPWTSGTQAHIGAALQAINNARFLWLGDLELLNNEYTKWAFQEKSVVRSVYFKHHLQYSDEDNERLYKVNEPMHYEIALQQWDSSDNKWVAYEANDVQLDFTMLDPYYRLTMNHTVQQDQAIYTADFKLPDQYGMFTFRVLYKRPGISFIDETDVVTVRHIANDEWPRSWEITNSWVYLSSIVSVVIAWLVFVLMFIYSPREVDEEKKNK